MQVAKVDQVVSLPDSFQGSRERGNVYTDNLRGDSSPSPHKNMTSLAAKPKMRRSGGVHCTARRKRVPIIRRELRADFELPSSDSSISSK